MTSDGTMAAGVLWNHLHRAQIMHLVSMAIALALSWFHVWSILAPFDFIAVGATLNVNGVDAMSVKVAFHSHHHR
ncbi:MAG TPA: hypothetical protein VMG09_00305 [Bacteroidota bacterium]|nr:hypothetical protein [Bacteroidota bacterium]